MKTTELDRVRAGFDTLDLDDSLKRAALEQIERWLEEERFRSYAPYVRHLIAEAQWDVLLDSFYRMIPFGTGGRRGAVGVGANRFNPYTLATSVQGHVEYLRQRFGAERALSVVVAYDVRHFHDLRGLFGEVEGPLKDLTSKDLAWLAARVYAANRVSAWILPPDSGSYVSTPELSFLIRELGADGGLNVSASHNHPDDNGGKFYNQLGGQEIPPDDEVMARIVEGVRDAQEMSQQEALDSGRVKLITPELRERYLELNRSLCPEPRSKSAHIVFTALHGTGSTTVQALLKRVGFQVTPEPSQAPFDGAFPNVPFRIANPEVPQSMGRAAKLAQELGADLVMSTDPDADRLGMMAPDAQGSWRGFTGNELAALLLHHAIQGRATQGEKPPFVVTTWVTTQLLARQAKAAGMSCVSTLPVGFKFIADVLRKIEEQGRYEEPGWDRALDAELSGFVFGTEESHGYLMTSSIRDKDAAGAGLLLAELASECKDRGETLQDVLDRIHLEQGVVINRLVSLVMLGAPGLERIRRIQASLRSDPPREIGGLPVRELIDWHDTERFGPFSSETDHTTRNVLSFLLEGGHRVTIRPSGTEPKNKTYVETVGEPLGLDASPEALAAERARLEALAARLADGFALLAMSRIGETLPEAALRVSDLVPLEHRVRVVEELVPALIERLGAAEGDETALRATEAWWDQELKPCGNDARGLVADGVTAVLAQRPELPSALADRVRALTLL